MRQSLKKLYSEQDKNGGGGGGGRQKQEGNFDCGIPRQALVKDVNVFRQSDSFSGLLVTIGDALSSSSSVRNPPEFEVMFSPVSGFRRFVSEGTLAKRITGLEVSRAESTSSLLRDTTRANLQNLIIYQLKAVVILLTILASACVYL